MNARSASAIAHPVTERGDERAAMSSAPTIQSVSTPSTAARPGPRAPGVGNIVGRGISRSTDRPVRRQAICPYSLWGGHIGPAQYASMDRRFFHKLEHHCLVRLCERRNGGLPLFHQRQHRLRFILGAGTVWAPHLDLFPLICGRSLEERSGPLNAKSCHRSCRFHAPPLNATVAFSTDARWRSA